MLSLEGSCSHGSSSNHNYNNRAHLISTAHAGTSTTAFANIESLASHEKLNNLERRDTLRMYNMKEHMSPFVVGDPQQKVTYLQDYNGGITVAARGYHGKSP